MIRVTITAKNYRQRAGFQVTWREDGLQRVWLESRDDADAFRAALQEHADPWQTLQTLHAARARRSGYKAPARAAGARAAAANMTPEERRARAQKAAASRWQKPADTVEGAK